LGTLLLIALALFILTRRKYYLSIPKIFIPKLTQEELPPSKVLDYLTKLKIDYADGEWRISVKPITVNSYQIQLPIAMYLPKYSPLALPQIAWQIKDKVVIEEAKVLDKTAGYWVYTKEPIVVYI